MKKRKILFGKLNEQIMLGFNIRFCWGGLYKHAHIELHLIFWFVDIAIGKYYFLIFRD